MRANSTWSQVVTRSAGNTSSTLQFDAIRVVVLRGSLGGNDALSGLKRVSIIARGTSVESRSVGLAKRVHLLAAHARSKEVARVAAHADSGLISGFAVGIAAGGWRVSDRTVAVVETVARVAGETSSGVGIAGLAERIALDAHEGRIQEESTVTLLADSISQVLAVDIAVRCTSDCASRTSNHIPRVTSQASSGVGIGSPAKWTDLPAFSSSVKEEPR